jgi:hypothetical protein
MVAVSVTVVGAAVRPAMALLVVGLRWPWRILVPFVWRQAVAESSRFDGEFVAAFVVDVAGVALHPV